MRIKIDGEIYVVDNIHSYGRPMIDIGDMEFYLFESSKTAGEEARNYWEDLAQDDAEEFAYLVGTETLVSWALAQSAGPGYTKVNSLEEWLDLWLDIPEEQWASYDGTELDVDVCGRMLSEELGFVPTVAYRHN